MSYNFSTIAITERYTNTQLETCVLVGMCVATSERFYDSSEFTILLGGEIDTRPLALV